MPIPPSNTPDTPNIPIQKWSSQANKSVSTTPEKYKQQKKSSSCTCAKVAFFCVVIFALALIATGILGILANTSLNLKFLEPLKAIGTIGSSCMTAGAISLLLGSIIFSCKKKPIDDIQPTCSTPYNLRANRDGTSVAEKIRLI